MLIYSEKAKDELEKNIIKKAPVESAKSSDNGVGTCILSILSVLAVASYPVFFLYFQNADEASFSEVIVPLLIFIAAGMILFATALLFVKSASKAAIITNIFMLVLLNYLFLENGINKIFPDLRYWHVLPIFLFILFHIAWFINKKLNKEIANTTVLVLCIVFCGLILFNGVTTAPAIINKISIEKQAREQKTHPAKKGTLPNIYFLIFDEYSSIDFMKKYYNYDNSAFTDYLEEIGFNVSYTSHNESIQTATVTTNLVNLEYLVTTKMSISEKNKYRKDNYLIKYIEGKGYGITGVGSVVPYGIEHAESKYVDLSKKTVDGKAIMDIIFGRTFVYPFYRIPNIKAEKEIISAFQYLKNPKNYTANNFIFCHLECPHEPFYFDKNGYTYNNPGSNWKDKKYYLGQYIYTTNNILEIVESIVENDPNSCIILQSDHSARASSDPDLFMELFALEDMSNIFNAVYLNKEKIDIEGLSGVNTLRYVFNLIFGDNFGMLDLPIDDYKYK